MFLTIPIRESVSTPGVIILSRDGNGITIALASIFSVIHIRAEDILTPDALQDIHFTNRSPSLPGAVSSGNIWEKQRVHPIAISSIRRSTVRSAARYYTD